MSRDSLFEFPSGSSISSVGVVGNLVVTVSANGEISTRNLSCSLRTPIYNWLLEVLDQLCQIEEEVGCVFASEFLFPIPLSVLKEINQKEMTPEETVEKMRTQTAQIIQEARVASKCFSSSNYKLVAGRKALRNHRNTFKAIFSPSPETSYEESILSLISVFGILSRIES